MDNKIKKQYIIIFVFLFLVSIISVSAYTSSNIVAFYNYESSDGIDTAGNIPLTMMGTPLFGVGKLGSIAIITNNSKYGIGAYNSKLNMTEGSFCSWVKPVSLSSLGAIMSRNNGTLNDKSWEMENFRDSGGTDFTGSGFVFYDTVPTPYQLNATANSWSVGTWTYICDIFNKTNGKADLYINGLLNATTTTGTRNLNDGGILGLVVGCRVQDTAGSCFKGYIDATLILNVSLTASEVLNLYNNNGDVYSGLTTGVTFNTPTPNNNTYYNISHNYIEVNVTTIMSGLINTTLFVYKDSILYSTITNASGNITYNFTGLSAGTYQINATAYNSTTSISTDNRTIYVGKGVINIIVYNSSGISINTFNANINGVDYPTTIGTIIYNPIIGVINNITISATGYAYDIGSIQVNDTTLILYNRTLYPPNSVYLYVRDEITGALLNTSNTTIVFSGLNNQYTYTTSNGTATALNLSSGTYSVSFTNGNYSVRTYMITVGASSTQSLTAYLTLSYQTVTFTYVDSISTTPLSNVSATMYGFVNGTLQPISSQISDPTGRIQWTFRINNPYTFYSSANGYLQKTLIISPAILFTAYNVPMVKSSTLTTTNDIFIYSTPNLLQTTSINSWSIYFNSPNGLLESYSFNLTSSCYNNASTGINSNGQVFILPITLTGCADANMFLTTSYTTSTGITMAQTVNIPIRGTIGNYTFLSNQQQTFGMGVFERVLIVTIITLVVGGVASIFGGLLAGVVIGLFMMAYFSISGFVPQTTMLVPILIGFVLFLSKGVN